jgi:hypothetical protein
VSQLEGIRKREEANLKALQLEHEALKKEQFRAGQGLHALRSREQELVAEIAGGQSQSRNLTARLKALDEQLLSQGELMYAVDLNLQVRAALTERMQMRALLVHMTQASWQM